MGIDLTGRVALVTGGGAGIGYEVVLVSAKHGSDVAVIEKNREALSEVTSEVQKLGRKVLPRQLTLLRGTKWTPLSARS